MFPRPYGNDNAPEFPEIYYVAVDNIRRWQCLWPMAMASPSRARDARLCRALRLHRSPSSPRVPMAAQRVPTVDDLRVKLCYICREEERYDHPEEPRRAWTHPCSCTLVAHESCLLHWITAAQQDPSRAGNALKCPQCGAKYELESDNPFVLKMLDNLNAGMSFGGKVFMFAGFGGIVVSIGFGIYIVCTAFGAALVRQFLGREMYDLLLTEDPNNWPWHAYINLPLVPLSLVLSRTRLFDAVPIVPLFLVWPSSPPVATSTRMVNARWTTEFGKELFPTAPVLAWPPSPIFATFLFPIVSGFYRRTFSRLRHWVMGTQPRLRPPVRRVVWAFNDDGPGALRVQVGANIVDEREVRRNDAIANNPAEAAERTMRVTNASMGRFVGGALMMPMISNYMGKLLLRLSHHSDILRKILAAKPPQRGYMAGACHTNYVQQFGMGIREVVNLICGGTRVWADHDPVWWRNSLGLGIFIVAKDCLQLLHLWLSKRELETRKVKSRPFEGVDMNSLDLIDRLPQH
ncbi:hypothetical protein B0H21DRAFT_877662 [Amylocystis lapponica]|nr:hypothetical protein B0H21DRAFT_877662 [Amylocystis lapponica]